MTPETSMKHGASAVGAGRIGRPFLRRRNGGYILLELILATILFTVAVVGLAQAARIAEHSFASLSRENDVRLGLRSFLEEVRRKPVAEMAQTIEDPRLGVVFRSEVDELTLKNASGTVLRDLYKLRAIASDQTDLNQEEESVEMWIYKPRTEERR
jgi:hypothetical protein